MIAAVLLATSGYAQDADSKFASVVSSLTSRAFEKKQASVARLAGFPRPKALRVLRALRDGDLYYVKKGKRVVVVAKDAEGGYALTDAITGEALGTVKKRRIRKIGINNNLRGQLRGVIASMGLFAKQPATRLKAARNLLKNAPPGTEETLARALEAETDPAVVKALRLSLATLQVNSGGIERRLAAIETLSGSMAPEVRVLLAGVLAKDASGFFLEPAAEAREAATTALAEIDRRLKLYRIAETLFFGLSLGSVLLISAVGLAITFGVMGVINMAHGEMLMLGAYTAFVVQQAMPRFPELSLLVALPVAFVAVGAVGMVIERTVIRVLYGRPLETLLATFGLSLILQQAVRTVFGPLNQPVVSPAWISGAVELQGGLVLTYNRLYIILFSLLVFAGLILLLRYTSFGLQMRAVTQNRAMASSMGIRTDWVDSLTFGLGSGIAGLGGVALSQLTNVGPNLGQGYIIDSFMVVVFGGVGNLWGTFFGSLVLGVANKVLEPFSGAVLAKILVLVFIILFIQRRPRGLFALRGRAAEA